MVVTPNHGISKIEYFFVRPAWRSMHCLCKVWCLCRLSFVISVPRPYFFWGSFSHSPPAVFLPERLYVFVLSQCAGMIEDGSHRIGTSIARDARWHLKTILGNMLTTTTDSITKLPSNHKHEHVTCALQFKFTKHPMFFCVYNPCILESIIFTTSFGIGIYFCRLAFFSFGTGCPKTPTLRKTLV